MEGIKPLNILHYFNPPPIFGGSSKVMHARPQPYGLGLLSFQIKGGVSMNNRLHYCVIRAGFPLC